jgi:hypothetical protein
MFGQAICHHCTDCLMYSLCSYHQTPHASQPLDQPRCSKMCQAELLYTPLVITPNKEATLFCHQTCEVHISSSCRNVDSTWNRVNEQRYCQKAGFSTNYCNEDKTNESNIQELQESLNQKTYENITADDYCNIDNAVEAGAAVKEFTENHQQNKEEEDDEKLEEKEEGTFQKWVLDCKLELYRDTLKTSKNLHEFHYIIIILNCWHNLQDKNTARKSSLLVNSHA